MGGIDIPPLLQDADIRNGLFVSLQIAMITDHLAGHLRQCEAIVAAIAEVRPVDVTRLEARVKSPVRSHHLRRLVLSLPHAETLLPLTVKGEWRKPFDLIVSASGSTITGNVLLKRRNRARNMFSGFVRGVAPGDIDCILAHQPEHATTPQHIFGPVPVVRFAKARRPKPFTRLSGSKIGVIVGGEARGAGFDFDDGYCERLFARLADVDRAVGGVSWVVVTSRRTPATGYAAIENFCGNAGSCDFVDFRNAGLGSISRAYDCDAVLLTEDSKTMVSEFSANGYPTAVLRVPKPGGKSDDYFETLRKSGAVPFISPEEVEADRLETMLAGIRVSTEDVYARLRGQIASRIPELFNPGARQI